MVLLSGIIQVLFWIIQNQTNKKGENIMLKFNKKTNHWNQNFFDSVQLNNATFMDYMNRFKKIATSLFEWVNLPSSMDSRQIEQDLFFHGQCALFKDDNAGFINTKCSNKGKLNIYGLPTSLNCYSFTYNKSRNLYTGLEGVNSDDLEDYRSNYAVLVMNDWERIPTANTIQLFSYRLYECEMSAFINIKAQKTPILIVTDEKQRLMMENLYSQYDGNKPFIFGDKNQLSSDSLKAINTQAPFVALNIMEYKKKIWNEALTFLGINNIIEEKKERLVTDEANSNNELINLNLQSFLAPRKEACKQFNELFGFTNTEKAIDVRVRSDLRNIIKNAMSVVQDFQDSQDIKNIKIEEE